MKQWSLEDFKSAILSHGLEIAGEKEIDHGIQLSLSGGAKANWYTSGKVVVQGKDSDEKALLVSVANEGVLTGKETGKDKCEQASAKIEKEPKVFVVYGHDTEARDQLELMLLRMNIKPVILGNLAPDGKTIIEALIANTDVPYSVVLLTPDDEGHLMGKPEDKEPRARQNVVLELGMFLAKLGRDKVAILHKGQLELPSDINGLIYIQFDKSVQEAKNKLAASLQKAGFYIDIENLSAE